MSQFDLIVKQNGEIHKVGSSPLVMINGSVHTYDSDAIDEPYLKEWGWQCCSPSEKEIYRWMYRCMLEGLDVPKRTVEVYHEGDVEFVTDCKASGLQEVIDDIVARKGDVKGYKMVEQILNHADLTFMRIPVAQFGIEKENVLYTICQRVMMDNPLLMFPYWPSENDSIAAVKNEMNICRYIYSVVPTKEKRAQAREICEEQIGKIVKKVEEFYGIRPGDDLTVAQKTWVLKVIHDYIVLHGNMNGKNDAWWLFTPYSVYDQRYKGDCTSYTMAFCAAARMFSIEAINMTGVVYIDVDNNGNYLEEADLDGNHTWIAVRLSDEEYGTYPKEPEKWSCIDVYWDEPAHEGKIGLTADREDVIWKYFLNPETINILTEDDEKTGHSYRIVDASITYNALPFDSAPVFTATYDGDEIYTWRDDV